MKRLKFEKEPVEVVKTARKVTDHLARGMNGILVKKKGRGGKLKGHEDV